MYGTFTTPPNSISGSAVCAFSMQDIADTFEGTFKEQSAINSNWLPVNSAKVSNLTQRIIRHIVGFDTMIFPSVGLP